MAKIILFVFLALAYFAFCSANAIESGSEVEDVPAANDSDEGETIFERMGRSGELCRWIPKPLRNAACHTWCTKVQFRPDGRCEGHKCVCA
ncbi:CLUMA_CG002028, isoform A [Clunio marinus]|uniref:CLUMA_CG002028, isoform A n=1 Tax=Clunio marinus TaxID=568069 RepID=A0A1J1HJN2_9DIPT|nr:CLUMA_CG002028, isoform A [Clunio marinus]